ncbi:hypothetical protein ACLOJK_041592 [Asimina triloba]
MLSILNLRDRVRELSALEQELSDAFKKPIDVLHQENPSLSASSSQEIGSAVEGLQMRKVAEHRNRVLAEAEANEGLRSEKENAIKLVTESEGAEAGREEPKKPEESKSVKQSTQASIKVDAEKLHKTNSGRQSDKTVAPDTRVRLLKDQLIRAKVLLGLGSIRNNPPILRELRLRIKEVTKVLGDATKDTDLPKR